MEKRKIAIKLAKFYLRYGRGSGLIDFFKSMFKDLVYFGILLDLAYRYLHITVPVWIPVILVIGSIFVYYALGLIDEKIGFWKFQNSYMTKELNPYFEEMSESIKQLTKESKNKNQ